MCLLCTHNPLKVLFPSLHLDQLSLTIHHGCVWAAADDRTRCDAHNGKPPHHGVGLIHKKNSAHKRDEQSLERRYTTPNTNTSFAIGGGTGICGDYTTDMPGACLWVGTKAENGDDPTTAGWLNDAKRSNCGKQIYVQRKHQPYMTQYVPLIDGCLFYTKDVAVGCFQIALTTKTFNDLKPSQKELDQGYLEGLIWDYNNEHGSKSRNGPI
ncbi:hypothetical protein CROQUDRAFT_430845 [Cronartium quercuum f. sp. fusiforme G11]|uniref:Uncharacterized protein n=1 Tax=Cronartium quercuum f. sp. fusiforme G11 TaxID=708437 RepID=A0A9P6NQ03_9BASI|nr:hypothetical protein CROQUDRAFT_430845 [Cronartium quercuum f. sp. fusiforme G11]